MKFKTWERCLELSVDDPHYSDDLVAAAFQNEGCSEWNCLLSQEWDNISLVEIPVGYRLCPEHLKVWLLEQSNLRWVITPFNPNEG